MVTCGGPPRLQRRAVALRESKLMSWKLLGTDLILRLDGYVHASLGVPGQDQGTGWSQELTLVVHGAHILEEPRELPLWISGGAATIAGEPLALLPVPFDEQLPLVLRLEGAAETLAASGSGLTLAAIGEPRFVERVAAQR